MPEVEDILARLDAILAELLELRGQVAVLAEQMPAPTSTANGFDAESDFAPELLIDTHSAAVRAGYPRDTVTRWCRDEGIAIRSGGRWKVSTRRLRALISTRKN